MKRIIISLLFIITVLCGYFYEKQKAIVYQKEVNEGLQQYLNERNNDEDRASSHVRKDVMITQIRDLKGGKLLRRR